MSSLRLAWAIYDVFRRDFVITGFCQLTQITLELCGAFALRFVLQEAEGRGSMVNAIGLLLAVVAMFGLACALDTWRVHLLQILSSAIRGSLSEMIHQKNLRLSQRARHVNHLDIGKVMALINNDIERLTQCAGRLHIVWVAPLALCVAISLLCVNITYSALPGFALFILIAMPLTYYSNNKAQNLQRKTDAVVRVRSSVISTVIYAIRFVKLHVWESDFADRVLRLRARESHLIVLTNCWNTSFHACMRGTAAFTPMLSLVVYSYSGHDLAGPIVFSTLAVFSLLMWPVGEWPLSMRDTGQARLSHDELQRFLLHEEQNLDYSQTDGRTVALVNASFSWETNAPAVPFTMSDVNITFQPGVTAIVGAVGSGKSSLLSALAGEMRRTAGQIKLPSTPAFCAQLPWIRNASVRDNIIFGHTFDATRYQAVVDACALRHDIDSFPNGHSTEIGEKGVVLSGGQKQRLNLARAIYADTDVLLADDPLSAVDAPIGRHIFTQAIKGVAHDKTIIMATHKVETLEHCDHIVWMSDARVRKQGKYYELLQDEAFAAFVGSHRRAKQSINNESIMEEAQSTSLSEARQIAARGLMMSEDSAIRHVHIKTLATFLTSDGDPLKTMYVYVSLILCEGASILSGLWLAWWIDDRFTGLPTGAYVGILLALSILVGITSAAYGLSAVTAAAHANYNLCEHALDGVLRAPMTWFDGQPSGRILARFQGDVMQLDLQGQMAFKSFVQTLGTILAIFILTTAFYYYFAVALIGLFAALAYLLAYTHHTTRELRRLATLKRNQAVSLIQEASTGYQALRQYDRIAMFDAQITEHLEGLHVIRRLEFSTQTWMYTAMSLANLTLVLVAGILVIFSNQTRIAPGVKGVVLSTALALFQLGRRTCLHYTTMEDTLHSCERLHHYAEDLPHEAALTVTADDKLSRSWPERGAVTFRAASMRYRPNMPLILQDVDLNIAAGEKVGLVGRTGSGKSSMLNALFRMVELASGSIEIDGVDISTIGLHKLRSSLSIIPQDPLLLEGTVRSNIDPSSSHGDAELQIYLDQAIKGSDTKSATSFATEALPVLQLESTITTNGANLSLGQRQQVSLVRALHQKSQVVVLDEATSSIDARQDALLQSRLIKLLEGKTVISIAHRLSTIIGFDRVVVLSEGRVVEVDEPVRLFDREGEFRRTCAEAGVTRDDIIRARSAAIDGIDA